MIAIARKSGIYNNRYPITNNSPLQRESGTLQLIIRGCEGAEVRGCDMRVLRNLNHCSLIGYEGGSFAVVSNDDYLPELLGVCTTGISGEGNANFEWWLQSMDDALKAELERSQRGAHFPSPPRGEAERGALPDGERYPLQVGPLITTRWAQTAPYNNACPKDPEGYTCLTGCVATSMAQVLAYHRMPLRGQGERTIYVPYQDVTGNRVDVHFGSSYYDWDNMLDSYEFSRARGCEGTEVRGCAEIAAVAKLMLDCGVAADMEYGSEQGRGGSAALASDACEGLVRYFGFQDAKYYQRDNYSESEWMEMVFRELSENGPIIYGGRDGNFGHSFVVHGYREDGFVYVNWGWGGNADGYYDIALLNPSTQKFKDGQGMICGVKGDERRRLKLTEATAEVSVAGTLAERLPGDALSTIGELTVRGTLNGTDLGTLRRLTTEGCLQKLDMRESHIAGGGEAYFNDGKTDYFATDNTLPAYLFKDSPWLMELRLPEEITAIGDGALAYCPALRNVSLPSGDEQDYIVVDQLVYTRDSTELVCGLSPVTGKVKLLPTVSNIHPYALSGCIGIDSLDIASMVGTIGAEAFSQCGGLMQLRCRAKTVPTLTGYDTFKGLLLNYCELNIPSGTKTQYGRKAQWKDFVNISEFGTTVKAKNAVRERGKANPEFGYEMTGELVPGTPELYTDATPTSPEGVYTIYVKPGTITAPDVEYVNGKLVVVPSTSTGIDDATNSPVGSSDRLYDVQGRLVSSGSEERGARSENSLQHGGERDHAPRSSLATPRIKKGIYIKGGKKVVCK